MVKSTTITLPQYVLWLAVTTSLVVSILSIGTMGYFYLTAPAPLEARYFEPIPITHKALATAKALRCGVEPAVFHALIQTESAWRPDATSEVFAYGLTQLMPKTAKWLGINRFIVSDNLQGGACYLRSLIDRYGSVELALKAYHAGPGNVDRGRIGPKSRAYARRVVTLSEETAILE